MKCIFLCLWFLCVGSLAAEPPVETRTYSTAWGDSTVVSVSYGYIGDRLYFAVFESARQVLDSKAALRWTTSTEGANVFSGHIMLPDGTKADLPSSHRIYEVTFGEFASAPITFTRSQLEAYLEAKPQPPTIEGLRKFLSK